MAVSLVKIKDVVLYVGLTANGAECFNAQKLLADNNINHKLLAYNDISQHKGVFDSLNTWRWGAQAEQRVFTDFPIVHWTECYSDFSTQLKCAASVTELNNSVLIANKQLVD
jgi:hypothetical protein